MGLCRGEWVRASLVRGQSFVGAVVEDRRRLLSYRSGCYTFVVEDRAGQIEGAFVFGSFDDADVVPFEGDWGRLTCWAASVVHLTFAVVSSAFLVLVDFVELAVVVVAAVVVAHAPL